VSGAQQALDRVVRGFWAHSHFAEQNRGGAVRAELLHACAVLFVSEQRARTGVGTYP
jgi:hypothetical protein